MKVLYIAGYGRSGSTVLAALLGAHPHVASVGEVSFVFDDWSTPGRPCSCGQPYSECAFWRDLFPGGRPPDDAGRAVRRLEHLLDLPRVALGWLRSEERREYRAGQERLFRYIAERAGATVVVDSSKSATGTAGRFVALRRLAGIEVYVLHLVRDGRSTLETILTNGSNWTSEGHLPNRRVTALRALVGWLSTNGCVSLFGRGLGRERYLLVRYEDLLANPSGELRRIGDFVGLDGAWLAERVQQGEAAGFGHMVGGNRVRFQGPVRLRTSEERPAGRRLSRGRRVAFTVLGGWLNRMYGYPVAPAPVAASEARRP